jgi:hypothetical protein
MFVAAAVYVCGWAYFLSKIDGLRNEFLLFRITDRETLNAGAQTVLPVMTVILIFGAISAFLLNNSTASQSIEKLSPPAGFRVVAEIDLSRQTYSGETLAEFTVEEYAYTGVFILVRDINTSYFDLRVVGPNDYSSIVLHGEGYHAERDGGVYRLVLTSNQSPGTTAIFLRTP